VGAALSTSDTRSAPFSGEHRLWVSLVEFWRRLDSGWKLALGLLLVQRCVLGAVALASVLTAPNLRLPNDPWPVLAIRGGEPWSLLLTTWHHWDAIRYYELAQNGYRIAGSGGLWPLFPFISRVVSVPLGGQLLLAEMIVASAAFVVAMRLLYELVHAEGASLARVARWTGRRYEVFEDPQRREKLARLTVLLVALFPTAYFLFAPYTEGLFLACSVGSLLYARQGRWWLAGLLGMLAALTRFPGAFLVLPLVFEYARQHDLVAWVRRSGGSPPRLSAAATLLPLVGMVAVPLVQMVSRSTRSPAFLFNATQFWGERLTGRQPAGAKLGGFEYQVLPPWDVLHASLQYVVGWTANPPASLPIIEALNLACILLFCVLGAVAMRRLPFMYSLYVWPSLALLVTRQMGFSPLMSSSRYVLVLFPCFLVLGVLLVDRRLATVLWLAGGAALQVVLLWFHSRIGFVA
jgi:hypothetical protein